MLIQILILTFSLQIRISINQYKINKLTKSDYDSYYIPNDQNNKSKKTIVLNTKSQNLNVMPLQYTQIQPQTIERLNIQSSLQSETQPKQEGIIIKNMPPKDQLLTIETLKLKQNELKKQKDNQKQIESKIEEVQVIEEPEVSEETQVETTEVIVDEKPINTVDTDKKLNELKSLINEIEEVQILDTQDPFDPRRPIETPDLTEIQFVQEQQIQPPDNSDQQQQQIQPDFFNRNINENNNSDGVMLFDQVIREQLQKEQSNFVDSFDDIVRYDQTQNNTQNQDNPFGNNFEFPNNSANFEQNENVFDSNVSQQQQNNIQTSLNNSYNIVFVGENDQQQQTNYNIQFVGDNEQQTQTQIQQPNQFQTLAGPQQIQNNNLQAQKNIQQNTITSTPSLQRVQRNIVNQQPVQRQSNSQQQTIQQNIISQNNLYPQQQSMQVTPKVQRGPQVLAIIDKIQDSRLQSPQPLIRRDSQNVQGPQQIVQNKHKVKKLFLQQNNGTLTPFFVVDDQDKYQEGSIYQQGQTNTQRNVIQQQTRPQINNYDQQQGFKQQQSQLNDPLIYSQEQMQEVQVQVVDNRQQITQQQPLVRQPPQQQIMNNNVSANSIQNLQQEDLDVPNQITEENLAMEIDENIYQNFNVPNQVTEENLATEIDDPTSGFVETNDFSNIKEEDNNTTLQNNQNNNIQNQETPSFDLENQILQNQFLQFEANLQKQKLRLQGIQNTNSQLELQTERLRMMQSGYIQQDNIKQSEEIELQDSQGVLEDTQIQQIFESQENQKQIQVIFLFSKIQILKKQLNKRRWYLNSCCYYLITSSTFICSYQISLWCRRCCK